MTPNHQPLPAPTRHPADLLASALLTLPHQLKWKTPLNPAVAGTVRTLLGGDIVAGEGRFAVVDGQGRVVLVSRWLPVLAWRRWRRLQRAWWVNEVSARPALRSP